VLGDGKVLSPPDTYTIWMNVVGEDEQAQKQWTQQQDIQRNLRPRSKAQDTTKPCLR